MPTIDPAAFVVEWYRPDRRKGAIRVWIVAASVVAAGALALSAAYIDAVPSSARIAAGILGGICTLSGPLIAVFGLHRTLGDESYLLLRGDGIAVSVGPEPAFIRWDELDRAEGDAAGALVLHAMGRPPIVVTETFDGKPAAALAERIKAIHRKAHLGLLRP